ncbi:3439_t:CDS:2 [Gigaspora rosea]|nr:3439_t:CDS:2 [Gigaspora rosea]
MSRESKPKPILVNLKSEVSKDKTSVTLSWEPNKAIDPKSTAVIGVKKGVCDSEGCKFVSLDKKEVTFSDKEFTFEGVDLDLSGGVTKNGKAYSGLTFANYGLPKLYNHLNLQSILN